MLCSFTNSRLFVWKQSLINLQPNLYRSMLELTISARSVTIYEEARTISMLLLSHLNFRSDHETWYEASCWVDGTTKATLQEFSIFLKDSANSAATPPISVELVHVWRKANLPLRSLPTWQLSPLLVRGLKYVKQASSEFGSLIAQVVTRCLFASEYPVLLALMVLENLKSDDVDSSPTHVSDLVAFASMIAFHDRCTRSARAALRDQLLETTFRSSTQTAEHNRPFCREYFNDHCIALTQQVKHLVLVNRDDDPALSLLSFLRRTLTVALMVSPTPSL